jgi:3'-5' exonuclease
MKALQQIKTEHIIAIDIETVRVAEHFNDLDDGTKSAWEYKNKQDGEIPTKEELSEKWTKNASLYAEFSKVCAVSIAFLYKGKLCCKSFYGANEKELLEALSISLENMSIRSIEDKVVYRLVGHASKYFDYPFLIKRFIINGMSIPNFLDFTHAKPWEQVNLCTNELWKVGGTGAGSSLQALCNALNVPVSKVDLVGDEVGAAFYRGEYERIGKYCSYDTVATFNVMRRFKQEKIFSFEEVVYALGYKDGAEVKEEKEELPLLKKIYTNNAFTEEIKSELTTLISKKKLTKKDKENLFTILRGVYVRKNFERGDEDSKKVILEKETEINEYLKTL